VDGFESAARGGEDGSEEEGGPGHEPDEAEAPEEPEWGGVIVVRDAEVEIAEEVLVHEIEPEPAVYVAVGWEGDLPVVVHELERSRMALGRVGEPREDVPGCGDGEEDEEGCAEVELAEAPDRYTEAAAHEEIESGDGYGKDDADEAFGEDVEGGGGGEAVAADAEAGGDGGVRGRAA